MIMAATNVAYRSYFYDFDTELYYLRSRYYDPEIGRFINADDVEFLGYSCTSLGQCGSTHIHRGAQEGNHQGNQEEQIISLINPAAQKQV